MASDAGKKDEGKKDEGIEFEIIESSAAITNGAEPDTEGGLVYPSGLVKLNTLGSGIWSLLITELGLHPDKTACKYGVNQEQKIVAVYAVDPLAEKNATAFRWIGDKKNLVSMHLKAVFKEKGELRPSGKRSVVVSRIKDKNGIPCLAIYLNIALAKRTTRRGSSKAGPDPNAAPGTDPGNADREG